MRRTIQIKTDLRKCLTDLKSEGLKVAAYGAPAKGGTLLECLEIGTDLIDFIADRGSLKQGRYTPGSHIPIVAPERMLADRPNYVLLLADRAPQPRPEREGLGWAVVLGEWTWR